MRSSRFHLIPTSEDLSLPSTGRIKKLDKWKGSRILGILIGILGITFLFYTSLPISREIKIEEVEGVNLKTVEVELPIVGESVRKGSIDSIQLENVDNTVAVNTGFPIHTESIAGIAGVGGKQVLKNERKYLTYLPHSGFHNQRMEIANALTLATLMNRTLLLPPIRLGKPLPWNEKSLLENSIIQDEECKLDATSSECTYVDDWRYLSWGWLLGNDWLESQEAIERFNSSRSFLKDEFGITERDTYDFADEDRRSIQIQDTPSNRGRFTSELSLTELNGDDYTNYKLLYFGSLFSAGRLKFTSKQNRALKKKNEDSIILRNSGLAELSLKISRIMGGSYLSLHARLNDGTFKREANLNMLSLYLTTMSSLDIPNKIINNFLAKDKTGPKSSLTIRSTAHSKNNFENDDEIDEFSPTKFKRSNFPNLSCRALHTSEYLLPLNIPVYLATDASDPETHPALRKFFKTFPCLLILRDFEEDVNQWDEPIELKRFLFPFLEAEIVGRGDSAFGTSGSTFSYYATGLLYEYYQSLHSVMKKLSR